ncbi:MAG: glycosyltransferase [Candidatus Woesearchaeota archaeon]
MLSIIIPTFNEREVILETVSKLHNALVSIGDYEIIVVDDDSPDKTWKLVKSHAKDDARLRVIRRKKNKGLSRSVVEGFSNAKGDYLLVIDADGQHDERIIPKMLEKVKSADIVLGSRFIKGGGVSGWSNTRLAISRFFSMLSRPLLKASISDPMSGLFLVRKSLFEDVKDDLDLRGYKILLAIVFASQKRKKLRIKEVPYVFKPRELGKSKAGFKVAFEYFMMLAKQAVRSNKKFLKFAVVGTSGAIVNFGLLIALTEIAGMYYVFSSAIAVETSIVTNFLLNNFWTWRKNNHENGFFGRFLRFNLVSLVALALNVSVLYLLTEYVGLWYVLANFFGILAGMLVNFTINDRWTFKNKS